MPKKRRMKKKRTKSLQQSSDSLDQLSLDDDTMKSMVSLATSEEDLINPTNTIINQTQSVTVETENDEHWDEPWEEEDRI